MTDSSIKEFTSVEWNEMMFEMKKRIMELHTGQVVIVCAICNGEMKGETHHDFDDFPHKRQYICTKNNDHWDYVIV